MPKKGDITIHKNGLIRGELALLKVFVKEPWKAFTLSEIKALAKKKSHHYVFEAMKKFAKMGILKEERKGNTNIYSLNYEDDWHIPYLAFIEALNRDDRPHIPYRNLERMTRRIKSPFYSMLVAGSYAEGKQKPTSDIDIAIIVPESADKKQCENALVREGELMVPEAHGFVFSQEEFYEMLVNGEFNFGKECTRKHILIWGAEPYYKILFEALKHGFKG